MILPFWAKAAAISVATVAALGAAFYFGTQHTQGKWDAERAAHLAALNRSLIDSANQGYAIGRAFEDARRNTYENYGKIEQGISLLDDPCRPSDAWWMLHDAAAGNRPAAGELNDAAAGKP